MEPKYLERKENIHFYLRFFFLSALLGWTTYLQFEDFIDRIQILSMVIGITNALLTIGFGFLFLTYILDGQAELIEKNVSTDMQETALRIANGIIFAAAFLFCFASMEMFISVAGVVPDWIKLIARLVVVALSGTGLVLVIRQRLRQNGKLI